MRFYSLILFVLIISLGASCNKKKQTTVVEEVLENKFQQDIDAKEVIITYQKTACFGTCPQFTLTIYNDYTCKYEGRNFVDHKGLFSSTTTPEKIKTIYEIAAEINYFQMNDEYNNKMVTDLPSIFTGLYKNGLMKNVHNRYSGPKELKNLYIVIDEAITAMEMKEIILD